MTIPFTKMHGLGNDYVYVDCTAAVRADAAGGAAATSAPSSTMPLDVDVHALARAMSDRHRGIGADGLILIKPLTGGADADVRMEMYNADGSRGEMCGNGIRCVAKYILDRHSAGTIDGDTARLRVQTDRGVLVLTASLTDGRVVAVRVNMGPPILEPTDIPVDAPDDLCVAVPLSTAAERLTVTCVSMGNPHAVSFVDDVRAVELARIGPLVERHPSFPNHVNYHVVQIHDRSEATMRTWERGSGLTRACGTGACAVLVAGVLENRLDRSALIHLPGGDLNIEWPGAYDDVAGPVYMTGPAVEVFSGTWQT